MDEGRSNPERHPRPRQLRVQKTDGTDGVRNLLAASFQKAPLAAHPDCRQAGERQICRDARDRQNCLDVRAQHPPRAGDDEMHADYLIVTQDSNKDGRFTTIAKENNIPLTEVEYALDVVDIMKQVFE